MRTITVTEPVPDNITAFLTANGLSAANMVTGEGIRVDDEFVYITVYLVDGDGNRLADGETTSQFNPIKQGPDAFGL